VLGRPGLKSHDSRRWQNHPHLSVSLVYLRDIILYLQQQDIKMYRLSPDLAPYLTHPDLPQFHGQIEECIAELQAIGELARAAGVRLSFHAPAATILNAPHEGIARKSEADLTALARLLDAMSLGPEAVVVTHVGGVYGDKSSARRRFIERYLALPPPTRRRLALENDDGRFSVGDLLAIHRETGARLVFDYLHFRCHNPEGMSIQEALGQCLATWPEGVRPKVHFSSPRTAMHVIQHKDPTTGRVEYSLRPPRPTQHADFIHPFEFTAFLQMARAAGLPDFDVMLEARAKDLALLHLREHLRRLAPDPL